MQLGGATLYYYESRAINLKATAMLLAPNYLYLNIYVVKPVGLAVASFGLILTCPSFSLIIKSIPRYVGWGIASAL
jgi:hypothetical protein